MKVGVVLVFKVYSTAYLIVLVLRVCEGLATLLSFVCEGLATLLFLARV